MGMKVPDNIDFKVLAFPVADQQQPRLRQAVQQFDGVAEHRRFLRDLEWGIAQDPNETLAEQGGIANDPRVDRGFRPHALAPVLSGQGEDTFPPPVHCHNQRSPSDRRPDAAVQPPSRGACLSRSILAHTSLSHQWLKFDENRLFLNEIR